MSKCLVCKEGIIINKEPYSKWYKCDHCGADSDELIDGFLYPYGRRGTLCSQYTPVKNLDTNSFKIGEVVKFHTLRKCIKEAKVIHIAKKNNQMILEDLETGKTRFVIEYEIVSESYDDLFSDNKVKYAGWWNKRIKFIHLENN